MRKLILVLIILMLPIFSGFADINYGSFVIDSNYQMRILVMKEKIMTPDVKINSLLGSGSGETIFPEPPPGSPAKPVIFDDSIEDMIKEKLYLRDLMRQN